MKRAHRRVLIGSVVAITLAILLPAAVSFAQTVTFGSATPFAVGTTPYSVAIGDLNGDGKPDLAVPNQGSGTLSILLSTGTGAFGAATDYAVGTQPHSVAIGDFNGDGKPDLAVVNHLGNTVSILLGTGTGAFGAASNFAAGTLPYTVAIGDLNGDGKLDLAVTNGWSSALVNTVSILLGTGTGAFGPPTAFAVGTTPNFVAIGDLDGDGKLDLAVSNFSSNSVSVLLGTGTGSFGAPTDYPVGTRPFAVAIGDLSGDGKPDLAVANSLSNSVSVLLGTGAGAFGTTTNFTTGAYPASVAIGDFNGDGKPDLAAANANSGTVSILPGDGTGVFGVATNVGAGASPYFAAIGDLNGDGKPDLAVAYTGNSEVRILLNTTVYSGSGAFGAPTAFAVGTAPRSVATGDLNGDGKLDLAVGNFSTNDVSILLGTGTGAFGAATAYAIGTAPNAVAIGDLNGDGRPDLAVSNYCCLAPANNPSVSILLGDGTGTFGAATAFAVGPSPSSPSALFVAIGDLNGDGKPDLAVTNYKNHTVSVLLGDGTGAFGAATPFAGAYPYDVAIGDLNRDGKPDLAMANYSANDVSVLLGDGTGAFAAATTFHVQSGPYSLAIGDLNWDGKPDLAVANQNSGTVSILVGTGTGTFGAATSYAVGGTNSPTVAIGDLNRDGKPDVVIANYSSNSLSILHGTGTGLFGPTRNVAAGTGPHSVAIRDFNRDGRPDLVVTNLANDTVSVLLNNGAVLSYTLSITKVGTGSGTVASSAAGINCGSTCSAPFDDGAMVTLTATPDPTSTFAGWSGACSGAGSCVVTMDAAKTVTATFTAIQLSVAKVGTGGGTVTSSPVGINCGPTCSATFASGTLVTLTATPDSGSTFTGWSGICGGASLCTVTMVSASSVTATFTATRADLQITKIGSYFTGVVGQNLTYTISVTNYGPSSTAGVTVTDVLPAGVTFVSRNNSQGTCTGTSSVICNLGTLAPLGFAWVTIVVVPTSIGTISNTASISGDEDDPNMANNSSTITTVINASSADLYVSKGASPDPVMVGTNVVYTIVAGNNGPSTATGVTVTDSLPAGVTYVSAAPAQGTCSGTSTVTCSLGSLASGSSATVAIVVTPIATGVISNTVTVAANEADSNSANNSVTTNTTVVSTPVGSGPIITTVAGQGCYGGDGGSAASARLSQPFKIAIASNGDVYISDTNNHRVRKITAATNIITTFAGTGIPGDSGDGGAATSARLNGPTGLALDEGGGFLYVADSDNHRIRRVNLSTGVISPFAGTGLPGFGGDGGAATGAQLNSPLDLLFSDGNLYVADYANHRVRRINVSGVISTVAGTGTCGGTPNGTPAVSANLCFHVGLALDTNGDLYIAHQGSVLKVSAGPDGVVGDGNSGDEQVTTVAGGGSSFANNVPATTASVNAIAVALYSGRLYIADFGFRVRMVVPGAAPGFTGAADEIITTVAGTGAGGFIQDGVLATGTVIHAPSDVNFDAQGRMYFVDSSSRLRRVEPGTDLIVNGGSGETISTLAGGCVSADGGPATSASLDIPVGIVVDGLGNLYIGDQFNHVIRRVDPSGTISTAAGNGLQSDQGGNPTSDPDTHVAGDPGPADDSPTGVRVSHAFDLALDNSGTLYFTTGFNGKVRKITPGADGRVTGASDERVVTLFTGSWPNVPRGLAVTPTGSDLYFTTGAISFGGASYGCAVWRLEVSTSTLTVVAGASGFIQCGSIGDGGSPTSARLNQPSGITLDAAGNLYIADQGNHKIRRITPGANGVVDGGLGETITTIAGVGTAGSTGDGGQASSAQLNAPSSVRIDSAGNLYLADQLNYKIRRVDAGGEITTFAGTGGRGFSGDGGPATSAELNVLFAPGGFRGITTPAMLALDSAGNVYVADVANNRVRKVTVDTDTDGLPDYWEIQYGLNPDNPADAALDLDNDGFSNIEEFTGRTDAQDNLSIPTSATALDNQNQPIRLVVPPGVVINSFQWVDPATLPAPPSGSFPFGVVSMNLQVPQVGGSATVALTFPGAVATSATYNKYGPTVADPTNHWYSFATGSDNGDATLTLTVTDGGAGDHDLVANGVIVDPGGPFLSTASTLINISTRARVQTADNVMIGGFIVGGSVPKTVLIRARGGSLGGAPFNNPGVLANPTMQLYSGQTVIAQNNDWQTTDSLCLSPATACGGVPEITATGLDPCQPNPGQTVAPPGCAQESALYVTLPPATYTVIVRGVGGTVGMGLVEVFEADTGPATLINISTRARVETGDNVMIGGFIVAGTVPKTVLLRARGGSLGGAPFNNPDVLANLRIQLYSGQTVIAQNDDWQNTDPLCLYPATSCGDDLNITLTGLDPCQPNPGQTVPPPGCAQESALYVTLLPGTYTAIVRGVGGTMGMGLVEVFEVLPP